MMNHRIKMNSYYFRPIQHSRSDTDISNYGGAERLGEGHSSISGANSAPRLGTHITLADKINEIITNDYNRVSLLFILVVY